MPENWKKVFLNNIIAIIISYLFMTIFKSSVDSFHTKKRSIWSELQLYFRFYSIERQATIYAKCYFDGNLLKII